MPFELYTKIIDLFIKYYKKKDLKVDVACVIVNALIPICKDIENGKYDIKKEQQCS